MPVIELIGTSLQRSALKDGSGQITGGILLRVDGERKVIGWTDRNQEGCRNHEWVAKQLRGVEARHGIDGWYWNRDQGPSTEPVATSGVGAKKRQLWSLCIQHRSGDGAWINNYGLCGRPITEVGANGCPPHAAGQKRSDASMAAHRARWAEVDDRRKRARMLTGDLAELWDMACEVYGVEPERRGTPRVDEAQRAVVDNEVLQMFLRTLIDK